MFLPIPNRYLPVLKEYMLKFIGQEKVDRNHEIIERCSHNMVTESDFKAFMQFIVDVYETAYIRAVDDYREQFEKLGIEIKIGEQIR